MTTDPQALREARRLLAEAITVSDELGLEVIKISVDQARLFKTALDESAEALRPFAEPHFMGDHYVKFAPHVIQAARSVYAALTNEAEDGR